MKIKLLKQFFRGCAFAYFGVLAISNSASAQCAFGPTQYPTTDIASPTVIGNTTTVATCSFAGEHAHVTGFQSAFVYSIDIDGLSTPYITVFDASQTVVASGPAPLSFTPPSDGDYYTQWNEGGAGTCGTDNSCHTTSVTMTGSAFPCTEPAAGGTTVSTPAAACPSQNLTLTLSGASQGSGLTYQWQSSTDGITYTDMSGATSSSATTTQTVDTYYQCIVTCSGGVSSTSTPVQVNMNPFTNCYCVPTNQGGACITNVFLNQINNTTPGCEGTNNYNVQTATTFLAQGVSYNFNLTLDDQGISSVWIDWNQNGTYEASEWVQVFTSANSGSVTINVPLTAVLGNTGMRVRSRLSGNPNGAGDACLAMGSGETEDYIVNIVPPPTCPQPTAFTLVSTTTTSADLQWTAGGSETEWEIEYGPVGFTQGTGTTITGLTATTYTLGGLTPDQFYSVYVHGVCSPTDSSYYTGPINFNTYGQAQFLEWDNECGPGFTDISGTGTNINSTDDASFGLTLPWPWLVKGTLINSVTIGNNGGLLFNTTTGFVGYTPAGNGMYPFNQDLNTPEADGGVFYQTIGTTPGTRKFIIEWKDITHYNFPPATDGASFEIIYDEATTNIYYLYDDVIMGDPSWDNGADATISLVAPGQTVDVSVDDATYLTNNSCIKFSYTNCPRPTDFALSFLTADEIAFTWTSGLSNEPSWIIEYGPTGFTPGTGTFLQEPANSSDISSLIQNTTYDLYIYAACNSGDTSNALTYTFTTLPYCSNPANIITNTTVDSLMLTWDWNESSPSYPVTGFNIQYGMSGFNLYSGTTVPANGLDFADTVANPAFLAGGVYEVYVQALCAATNDTSTFVGPFTFIMPLSNDSVCGAENLAVNGTVYTFNNDNATVALNEASIAPPATGAQTTTGWTNSTLNNTTWFTFQAPASGSVRINNTAINYNGQAAVYEAGTCGDYATFTLQAANDNEIGGTSVAPNFTICGLTPGATYYLMNDGFNGTTGNYSISILPIILEAGTANAVSNICSGDNIDLFTTVNGNDTAGVWSSSIAAVNASINGSDFESNGLAYQVFNLQYRVTDGCAYDSIITQVHVFAPSHAGQDGTITACRNEPIDLLSGLEVNADLNGTWYNPSNAVLPNSQITTSNIPGQFNYDYIAGNGVCPDDTANVVVTVQSCNYLGLNEEVFNGVSLFPNPSEGTVFITSDATQPFDYAVTDANGRVIAKAKNAVKAAQTTTIDLNTMETGVYFIRLSNDQAAKVFRVVIQ